MESCLSLKPDVSEPGDSEGTLTLDVDGDGGLLAAGRRFVGRSTGDALAALDVGCRDVQRADRALSVTVTQQRLQEREREGNKRTRERKKERKNGTIKSR